jgi:hypothetical protein
MGELLETPTLERQRDNQQPSFVGRRRFRDYWKLYAYNIIPDLAPITVKSKNLFMNTPFCIFTKKVFI